MGFEYREYKRTIAFMILAVCLWLLSTSNVVYASCKKHEVKNAKEASKIIRDHWEKDYFDEITVKKGSNKIKVDNESKTFTETFSTDTANMKKAVSSKAELKAFLDKKKGEVYKVETISDGEYVIKAPYQSKRIVIQSAEVEEDYGAIEKYVCKDVGKTILIFDTAEKTQTAYKAICKKYGKKQCYVDEIVRVEELAQATTCHTWGGGVMGMETLRTEKTAVGKSPVTVAVIDTGIDTSNIIFQGKKILSNSYDFMRGSYDVKDTYGHGTHVAGIIANLTPDNVRFLILKVTNEFGTSTALSVDLALDYAIANNVDVVNISMGFMGENAKYYTFLDEDINDAYKKGIPVCVAAGNDEYKSYGKRVENCYPACNSEAITVSSIDSNKNLSWYSCQGSTIDFTAPGTNVESAGLAGTYTFATKSGTSMAAPHITAAMAYMKLYKKNLSVDGCCMELRKRCVDLGAKGWDTLYGYGYPNMKGLFQSTVSYSDWTVNRNLSAPQLLSCTNVHTGVKLTWNTVKNANGYNIYCKRNGEIAKRIGRVGNNVTQYVDTVAADKDVNLYYIEAYGNLPGGETTSARSNYVTYVALKPVKIVRMKALKKRNLAVTLKGRMTGDDKVIQIQFSKQKSFKKSKTKSFYLSGNVYKFAPNMRGILYVRVRTMMSINRHKYYSAWSSVKKIKVK